MLINHFANFDLSLHCYGGSFNLAPFQTILYMIALSLIVSLVGSEFGQTYYSAHSFFHWYVSEVSKPSSCSGVSRESNAFLLLTITLYSLLLLAFLSILIRGSAILPASLPSEPSCISINCTIEKLRC